MCRTKPFWIKLGGSGGGRKPGEETSFRRVSIASCCRAVDRQPFLPPPQVLRLSHVRFTSKRSMAYLRQSASVASAVCKQTATPRLASSVASVQTCSRFSSLSSCKFETCENCLAMEKEFEPSRFSGMRKKGIASLTCNSGREHVSISDHAMVNVGTRANLTILPSLVQLLSSNPRTVRLPPKSLSPPTRLARS